MKDVQFSVLLSVYKNEKPKHLKDSIVSISTKQSLPPSEIILVKDGRLSSNLDVTINKLQKNISCLKVYGYDQNKGLGYALNFGLKKCKYDLVFRMDTDDISHPKRFEEQIKFMNQNPEVSIIGCFIEEFYEKIGDINRFRYVPTSSNDINSKKFMKNPFNHMTVLFKKSMVQKVGGYIDMPGYEDYYLWIRLLKSHIGLNLNKTLVYARVGNNMIKRRHGFEFLKKEMFFQLKILEEGHITIITFLQNVFLRAFPRILPLNLLKLIYNFILRK